MGDIQKGKGFKSLCVRIFDVVYERIMYITLCNLWIKKDRVFVVHRGERV